MCTDTPVWSWSSRRDATLSIRPGSVFMSEEPWRKRISVWRASSTWNLQKILQHIQIQLNPATSISYIFIFKPKFNSIQVWSREWHTFYCDRLFLWIAILTGIRQSGDWALYIISCQDIPPSTSFTWSQWTLKYKHINKKYDLCKMDWPHELQWQLKCFGRTMVTTISVIVCFKITTKATLVGFWQELLIVTAGCIK